MSVAFDRIGTAAAHVSASDIQKVAASNAGNWIPVGREAGHPFGEDMLDEKAAHYWSSEQVLSAKKPAPFGPVGK